jgi:hypothetical protein
MTIENEELNDDQLFNDAVGDEPVETPETPATETEQPEKAEAEVAEKPEAEAEKPAVDDNAPLVPSWRLREINEEKRTLADQVAALKAEKSQWQRPQVPAAEVPKPTEKPAKPDPLLDPEGYAKSVREEIREEILADRRETSLHQAHKTYKTEFEEAYSAAQKHIDPALKARMQQSRDPGETLIEWHREMKTRAEVGTDLNAFKQRLRDEALKDPEFRKAAMEAWRSEVQPQVNGRPRVELPPSLNGASRSNAALRSSNEDVSDAELFEQTTG